MSKNNNRRWLSLLAAGVMAVALSGCGGGDDGAAGPQGPKGDTGDTGATGSAGPAGTGTVNLAAITPEAWEAAKFKAEVSKVTIASPPVVEFSVTDEQGNPVIGLEKVTSKSTSAVVAQYPNVSFALAKLVPRNDSNPSEWKSYIVTTAPSKTASSSCAANESCPTRPSTDNTGTLEAVAGTPGSYKYTFYRDVPGIKAAVAGMAASAVALSANNRVEDLGDLTFEPTLPHRLVIQISGAAPGTGSNTANGTTVTPAVNMANPVNTIYDFIPATGKVLTAADLTREDVNIASCNVCHEKLAIHGGGARVETRYCVVCHTEQRAYGYAKMTSTAGKFTDLKEGTYVNPATGITSYLYSKNTTATSTSYHPTGTDPVHVGDGEVMGNFTTMIHKIHNGTSLVKENYNYANVPFNKKGFSKLDGGQRMCSTCHDSKIATTADNHKKLPSRVSCGACHDGINWATGGGSTLGDKKNVVNAGDALPTSGHLAFAQADDSRCALCHTPENIPISHRMENLTANNKYILPGLATFEYQIASVAQNATSKDVTIKFRILKRVADSTGTVNGQDGEAVTLAAPSANGNPLAGFTSNVAFLLAYAKGQDGIDSPIDYTNSGIKQGQPISVTLASLLSTSTTATSANISTVGSLSARDAEGYYTATLRGNGSAVCGGSTTLVPCIFPDSAKMRTVALQGYFTQTGAPSTPQGATANVARHAISVVKTVNGDTARRVVVDAEKCSRCHEWFEGHGGNRVKETQVCVMCHNPNLATSGRGIADAATGTYPGIAAFKFPIATENILRDWTFFNRTASNAALKLPVTSNNFKDMIHGIHAGRDRVTPFQDARDRTSTGSTGPGVVQLLDFRRMDFPGKLNNCETCHVTAASSDQKTYNYVPARTLVSTYESIDAAYAAGIAGGTATTALAKTALNTVSTSDTVVTPFAAACVSCHDNTPAKAHISLNGGALNVTRAAAQPTPRPLEDVESCAVCHGPGREFDTEKAHK